LVRLGALRCFFAFGAVPRSARLAAVRVSFQHPGHAQCAPCAIEAADAMLSAPNCLRPSFQPQARRSFLAAAGVADVRAI